MPSNQPTTEAITANHDYGPPLSWEDGRRHLAEMPFYYMATLNSDGAPHVMPCFAVWHDGSMYFSSKDTSRKGRNLARDGRCVLSGNSATSQSIDIVVEGNATRVTDEATMKRVAEAYDSKYSWKVEVKDGRFDAEYGAPTAGDPPYNVYELKPTQIYAFPGTAGGDGTMIAPTRWRF